MFLCPSDLASLVIGEKLADFLQSKTTLLVIGEKSLCFSAVQNGR